VPHTERRDLGNEEVARRLVKAVGRGPAFLTVDRIIREILGGIALRKRDRNDGKPDGKEER